MSVFLMKELQLTLNEQGGTENGIIRIGSENCILKIIVPVGTEFHSAETIIHTNQPDKNGKEQNIKSTKQYALMEDSTYEMFVSHPGSYYLQLTLYEKKGPIVRFIVDPVITINGKKINSEALVIQTNYPRCIGFLQDWAANLELIANLGYNMIHLPPFQELGSGSHYAIKDQLMVSSELFPKGFPENKRWDLFKHTIKEVENKLSLGFMIDVVPNHVSVNTPWIPNEIEATYNEKTAPWLKPAMYVDDLLVDIANAVSNSKTEFPSELKPENLSDFRSYIIFRLKNSQLKEFFTIDEERALASLNKGAKETLTKENEMIRMRSRSYESPQRINLLRTEGIKNDGLYNKGSLFVDSQFAAALYTSADGILNDHNIELFKNEIHAINAPFVAKFESLCSEIADNYIGSIRGNLKDIHRRLFHTFFVGKERMHAACNGWIEGPQQTDFVKEGTDFYLLRKVNSWPAVVKLRYGLNESDSPFLWKQIAKYVRSVAEVAHAIRIDNAHSTPIHVAEYILREARAANPNVFVMVELFTESQDADVELINRLGINAFMREGVFRYSPAAMSQLLQETSREQLGALDSMATTKVGPTRSIPAVIFDITHDNELPRFNRLPLIAPIAMAHSPIASTRTFDDMLDFNPSVVYERRRYPLSKDDPCLQKVRRALNELHAETEARYKELLMSIFGNFLSILRFSSTTGEGIWMVVHFPGDESSFATIPCPCAVSGLVFEAHMDSWNPSQEMEPGRVSMVFNTEKSTFTEVRDSVLDVSRMPVCGVVAFRVRIAEGAQKAMSELTQEALSAKFDQAVQFLGITDINALLYRCDAEEREISDHGTYGFPEFGLCFYAGIEGILSAFDAASRTPKGMFHPVFDNVRDGNWLMDYTSNRLYQTPKLIHLQSILRRVFAAIKQQPRFLIPKFLDRALRSLRNAARSRLLQLMSTFVADGDEFVQDLAAASVAFYSTSRTAPLVNLDQQHLFEGIITNMDASMAAGLPHFSTGIMRCWGRDTFIALRGLFMITGRFGEARDHLIAFASTLRHGLLPNLFDAGQNPRYNSRDTTWWFLQALQDYAMTAPDGDQVFEFPVPQLFPSDESKPNGQKRPIRKMGEVVFEIMQRHASGIHFREWNAGKKIDEWMRGGGFNIDIVTDFETGFILGGNGENCGTWMDKMGSSVKAGNAGVPATPRNGAAVEIIGLLASTLRWLQQCADAGTFGHKGVETHSGAVTWQQWHDLLETNFEKWFYVPRRPEHDQFYTVDTSLVGRRGIYKDTVGSSEERCDMQFRPNLLVAMCVAPEIFDPVHAIRCLDLVEEHLAGKIGMKTLDPADPAYRPMYINHDDTDDFATSCGFSYHNGPEWVWLTGYFFRASMRFRRGVTDRMKAMLAAIKGALQRSPAGGLPELTQAGGYRCEDGCDMQAWSVAAILDILYDYSLFSDAEKEDFTKFDDYSDGEE